MTRKSFVKSLLMAVAVTACSEASNPIAPEAAPQAGLISEALGNTVGRVLELGSPRRADQTATATIGAAGGTLSAGGVTLTIPAGALAADEEITMTVPRGRFMEVEFAPHGLQFSQPATLSFDLRGANVSAATGRGLGGVYFEGSLANGQFRTLDTFDVRVRSGVLSFEIDHFSGYCVVTGMDNRCECDF